MHADVSIDPLLLPNVPVCVIPNAPDKTGLHFVGLDVVGQLVEEDVVVLRVVVTRSDGRRGDRIRALHVWGSKTNLPPYMRRVLLFASADQANGAIPVLLYSLVYHVSLVTSTAFH